MITYVRHDEHVHESCHPQILIYIIIYIYSCHVTKLCNIFELKTQKENKTKFVQGSEKRSYELQKATTFVKKMKTNYEIKFKKMFDKSENMKTNLRIDNLRFENRKSENQNLIFLKKSQKNETNSEKQI